MSAITDHFEKLQREEYKNPKSRNRAAMMLFFLAVTLMAALAAARY